MKYLFTIVTAVLLTANLLAQAPEKMSYQAVVRDADGNLIANQQIGMQISILEGSPTGTQVYIEEQIPTSNDNGLVSIVIGENEGFDAINWAEGIYFLKIETDPTGGTDYTITGTSQLLSIPYALHAKTAESISGTNEHYVGELYGGGIVFWVAPDGQSGLIASLDDIDGGSGAPWGLSGIDVPDCGSLTDGNSNTTAIINAGGSDGDAAVLCNQYSGGGFNDWYLPSTRELFLLALQSIVIDDILNNDGNPNTNGLGQLSDDINSSSHYWSSTEFPYTQTEGYVIQVNNSSRVGSAQRIHLRNVRAIRAF